MNKELDFKGQRVTRETLAQAFFSKTKDTLPAQRNPLPFRQSLDSGASAGPSNIKDRDDPQPTTPSDPFDPQCPPRRPYSKFLAQRNILSSSFSQLPPSPDTPQQRFPETVRMEPRSIYYPLQRYLNTTLDKSECEDDGRFSNPLTLKSVDVTIPPLALPIINKNIHSGKTSFVIDPIKDVVERTTLDETDIANLTGRSYNTCNQKQNRSPSADPAPITFTPPIKYTKFPIQLDRSSFFVSLRKASPPAKSNGSKIPVLATRETLPKPLSQCTVSGSYLESMNRALQEKVLQLEHQLEESQSALHSLQLKYSALQKTCQDRDLEISTCKKLFGEEKLPEEDNKLELDSLHDVCSLEECDDSHSDKVQSMELIPIGK